MRLHGLVERGIENGYLSGKGYQMQGCPNALNVRRIVKRGKSYAFLYFSEHSFVDEYGSCKSLTTVDNTMAYTSRKPTLSTNPPAMYFIPWVSKS